MSALCLAVVVNCLDRHAEEAGGRAALIWEKDQPGQHETVTYQYAWVVGLGGRAWVQHRTALSVFVPMLEKCSM